MEAIREYSQAGYSVQPHSSELDPLMIQIPPSSLTIAPVERCRVRYVCKGLHHVLCCTVK